jgi:hypothetical protein
MKSVLQLGTWNVQTMLLAGKMKEIANKLKIYNIQETRWANEGWINNKDNTLIYGGETNITGRNGTGLILDRCWGKKSKRL